MSRGRNRPPEVGAKISAAQIGKPFSDERKAILKAANRSRDPEVIARITAATRAAMNRPDVVAKMAADRARKARAKQGESPCA